MTLETTQALTQTPQNVSVADSPSGTFTATRLNVSNTAPFAVGGRVEIREGSTSEQAIVIELGTGTVTVEQLVNAYSASAEVTSLGRTNPSNPLGTTVVKNASGRAVNGSKNSAESYINPLVRDIRTLWKMLLAIGTGSSLTINSDATTAGDRSLIFQLTQTTSRILRWQNSNNRFACTDQAGTTLYPLGVGTPVATSDATPKSYVDTATTSLQSSITTLSAGLPSLATQAEMETATATNRYVAPSNQQYHPSAAKFWCRFDGSQSTPAIIASYNVSSVTRIGTGQYRINFTTPFSSASTYCAVAVAATIDYSPTVSNYSAGSVDCQNFLSDTNSYGDSVMSIVGFGDQ